MVPHKAQNCLTLRRTGCARTTRLNTRPSFKVKKCSFLFFREHAAAVVDLLLGCSVGTFLEHELKGQGEFFAWLDDAAMVTSVAYFQKRS